MRSYILYFLLVCFCSQSAFAQIEPRSDQTKSELAETELAETELAEEERKVAEVGLKLQEQQREDAVKQLIEIRESLLAKISQREELRKELSQAGENPAESQVVALTEINSEIDLLNQTFEQIAIGGIDLAVFGAKEEKFDWREELVSIVKPLIENVKGLTEKPRKIESLKRVIESNLEAKIAAQEALQSIEQLLGKAEQEGIRQKLSETQLDWTERLQDIETKTQLADYQLASLEGKNVPLLQIIKSGLVDFAGGRGLTLAIAIGAAIIIWFLMAGCLRLYRSWSANSNDKEDKVRYRLAAYGYRFLTGFLIAVAVVMVVYFRQDMLLMAILAIVLVGAAFALKNLLPKYVTEGRLLLNIGPVRENEMIMHDGIPWEVGSINMYSHFTNPELKGVMRMPISSMHEMISRPTINQSWFPSSKGDWILDETGSANRVVEQSVDMVELEDLDSLTRFMPTADYYVAGFQNLSRTEEFRVTILFGIDYATQGLDVSKIEAAFVEGIKKRIAETESAEFVTRVNCEFHSAGDSSLNYLMLARFKPDAARYYSRLKRHMQRACVVTCNENEWGIPFPQVSVHLPEIAAGSDENRPEDN